MKLAFCIRFTCNDEWIVLDLSNFFGKNHEENVMTLENTDDRIIFYYIKCLTSCFLVVRLYPVDGFSLRNRFYFLY